MQEQEKEQQPKTNNGPTEKRKQGKMDVMCEKMSHDYDSSTFHRRVL
jgi:hypothetical protein